MFLRTEVKTVDYKTKHFKIIDSDFEEVCIGTWTGGAAGKYNWEPPYSLPKVYERRGLNVAANMVFAIRHLVQGGETIEDVLETCWKNPDMLPYKDDILKLLMLV